MGTRYENALAFASRKHEGQKRLEGTPYITHPIAVAEMLSGWGYDEDTCIAGLFHDLLEDTDATEEEILTLGGEKVLRAVKCVTKHRGYLMDAYVSGIFLCPMARAVKAADRLHNLKSALICPDAFKARYVRESAAYFTALHPEMPDAIRALAESVRDGELRKTLLDELAQLRL